MNQATSLPSSSHRHVRGGKTVYGASVGILMLESRFPRIPGDMGNATSWPFPVRYRVVRGATPERVVRQRAKGLLEDFVDAAQQLIKDGCDGITTTCGFLSLFQGELAARCAVPVATSSLMQAPAIQAILPPGRRVGILTISAEALSGDHLAAAGVAEGTPVVGVEHGREFARVIIGDEMEMDVEAAERDLLEGAQRLIREHAEVGAILLECTNMVPHARAIAEASGRPVFTIHGFVSWFQAGLAPPRFSAA